MQQRQSRTIRGLALSAAILVAVTAASTRLFAATMVGEVGTIKDRMCRSIGCADGGRACADATIGLEIKEVGKAQVTYHCYEPGSADGGDVI